MTENAKPSLVDMQIQALEDVKQDALFLAIFSERLIGSLGRAQDLGHKIPILPSRLTRQQRAILEHVQTHYPFGFHPAYTKGDLGVILSADIEGDGGNEVSARTVERTLDEFGLSPRARTPDGKL
ncbi:MULTISPECIES: hypothetical protein [Asticcacaulis]|uniref:hypothetical protein n=1 Tax=Asticcacaulis TaxID=76890 RepID=UPI001AE70416|nr:MULTISPECIES: hypothetical protein [Asticcacaulis]MBP2159546.1 hypothetical protein [Asticcacaulis solisilvae]MDR6800627.1 hypothetical protein [Asticcacaulis sp. BE141]